MRLGLVLENDEITRNLIHFHLKEDCKLVTISTVSTSRILELLDKIRPDFLFLENQPFLDRIYKKIGNNWPTNPPKTILIAPKRTVIKDYSYDFFLPKPLIFKELCEVVKKVCEK